jgi:transcriptional regulator with XRE-family HTH domain
MRTKYVFSVSFVKNISFCRVYLSTWASWFSSPAFKKGSHMQPNYDLDKAAVKIRRWQKDSGFQGKEIAKIVGISAPYYSDIRKGKQRGSIGVLAKISDVLGHGIEDLFDIPPGQDAKSVPQVNLRELKKALRPVMGKQTDELVNCYKVWREAPLKFKRSLAVYCDVDIT